MEAARAFCRSSSIGGVGRRRTGKRRAIRDRAVAPPAPRTRHLRLAPPPRQAASAIRLFS
ncbi:hypothetical protein CNX72_09580 [Burkholderia pseudomallei]|nr:hypothetical protein CNX72_09580 [Burkholderia pseudomallei]